MHIKVHNYGFQKAARGDKLPQICHHKSRPHKRQDSENKMRPFGAAPGEPFHYYMCVSLAHTRTSKYIYDTRFHSQNEHIQIKRKRAAKD